MKKFAAILLVLALGACAGDAQTKATASLAIACDSYATALNQLTPRKASMSAANVARVDAANKVVAPICLPNSPFDPAVAVSMVQNGIAIIQSF